MRKVTEFGVMLCVGWVVYYMIEISWRGHSHWTMGLLGGICLVLIGAINNTTVFKRLGIIQQALIGSFLIITPLELLAGIILNMWLGLGIWDYSGLPFNIMGQISLLFSLLWIPLAVVAIFLDDWLRYVLFDTPKPGYKLF